LDKWPHWRRNEIIKRRLLSFVLESTARKFGWYVGAWPTGWQHNARDADPHTCSYLEGILPHEVTCTRNFEVAGSVDIVKVNSFVDWGELFHGATVERR
jgi:hypothetical protein